MQRFIYCAIVSMLMLSSCQQEADGTGNQEPDNPASTSGTTTSETTGQEGKELVQKYYDAYNGHDYVTLEQVMHQDIKVGDFTQTQSAKTRKELIDIIKWGAVLNSTIEPFEMKEEEGQIVVKEQHKSDRLDLFFGQPITFNSYYGFRDGQIIYIFQDTIPGYGRLYDASTPRVNEFYGWVNELHPDRTRLMTTPTIEGAEEFKKVIEEYQAQR